jgi:hypothetical protein
MRDCVEHFAEGGNGRSLKVRHFIERHKAEIVTGLLTLITMGVPFWWPHQLQKTLFFHTNTVLIISAIILGGTSSTLFVFRRYKAERTLKVRAAYHLLAHLIRDEQNKVYRRVTNAANGPAVDEHDRLYEYFDRISNVIAQFFENQIPNKGVAVGIRLAIESAEKSKSVVFSTFGRSDGLNSKRAETTEDIPSNEGIPRFFSERKNHGILIYNDLKQAHKESTYKMTVNDESYKDEIVTMMVAPLNGWDGKKTSMIGLLYVTSRNKEVFKEEHVDSMRFAADTIAVSVAFTVNTLKNCDWIKEVKRRRS